MISRLAVVLAVVLVWHVPANAQTQPIQDRYLRDCTSGDPARAIRGCTAIIARGNREAAESRAFSHVNRANAHSQRGNHDNALADYSAAIRLDPRNGLFLSSRAFWHARRGNLDAALADFDAAIRLGPLNELAFAGRGATHARRGDFDAAARDFNEALRIAPNQVESLIGLNLAHAHRGRYDEALAAANRIIAATPAVGHVVRGWLQFELRNLDAAHADVTESLRLAGSDRIFLPSRLALRGLIRRYRGDLAAALTDLDQAIQVGPYSSAYAARANVHAARGDLTAAWADINAALRLEPHNPFAIWVRAELFEQSGDTARALADYEAVLAVNPVHMHALVGRGRVRTPPAIAAAPTPGTPPSSRSRPPVTPPAAIAPPPWLSHPDSPPDIPSPPPGTPPSQTRPPAPIAPPPWLTFPASPPDIPSPPPAVASRPPAVTSPPATRSPVRVALVIGNAAYEGVARLDNPLNDADDVAAALRGSGFTTVQVQRDLTRAQLIEVLRAFEDLAANADWAVIYFAGHGIELGGTNYLIPVDARLREDRDVRDEAVPLDRVLSAIERARALRMVVLDACRDNPFVPRMRRVMATRSTGTRGLARIEDVPNGVIVAFAAAAGEVAQDGRGARNSPFAAAFIRNLVEPGVEIRHFFGRVRDDVLEATGGRQRPFTTLSLGRELHYFRQPAVAAQ